MTGRQRSSGAGKFTGFQESEITFILFLISRQCALES